MQRFHYDNPAAKYERLQMVGKGSFGQVYLVRNNKTGERAVMKCISLVGMGSQEKTETMKEANMLQRLDHPNIIKYIESMESNSSLKIVTEYAAKGDLHQLLKARKGKRLGETLILDWFLQICLGMKYLHSKHILHRDIKTSNIFLSDKGLIKIGDFGISKVMAHTMQCARTAVGTPYYMSPEICQNRPYNNRSDVWAMGCVLYELCTLKHAFEANSMKALVAEILREKVKPIHPDYSQDMRDLINPMLRKDPDRRPAVAQLLQMPCIKERIKAFLEGRATTVDAIRSPRPLPKKPLPPPPQRPEQAVLPPIPKRRDGSPNDAVTRAQQRINEARRVSRIAEREKEKDIAVHALKIENINKRQNQFKRANVPRRTPNPHLQPLNHQPVARPAEKPRPATRNLPPLPAKMEPRHNLIPKLPEREPDSPLVMSMKDALAPIKEEDEAIFVEKDGVVGVAFHNGVDPLQKFELNGATFKLRNTSPRDSLSQRVEVLRMHLEELLGSAKLMQVHRILSTVSGEEAGEAAISQVKDIMGPHKASYLPLIMQLIFCEESMI